MGTFGDRLGSAMPTGASRTLLAEKSRCWEDFFWPLPSLSSRCAGATAGALERDNLDYSCLACSRRKPSPLDEPPLLRIVSVEDDLIDVWVFGV